MSEKTVCKKSGEGAVMAMVAESPRDATLKLFDGETLIGVFVFPTAGRIVARKDSHPRFVFRKELRVNLRAGRSKYGRLLPVDTVKFAFAQRQA